MRASMLNTIRHAIAHGAHVLFMETTCWPRSQYFLKYLKAVSMSPYIPPKWSQTHKVYLLWNGLKRLNIVMYVGIYVVTLLNWKPTIKQCMASLGVWNGHKIKYKNKYICETMRLDYIWGASTVKYTQKCFGILKP